MCLLSVMSEAQREKWMLKMFIECMQKYAQYIVYLREKILSQKHIDFFLCLRLWQLSIITEILKRLVRVIRSRWTGADTEGKRDRTVRPSKFSSLRGNNISGSIITCFVIGAE